MLDPEEDTTPFDGQDHSEAEAGEDDAPEQPSVGGTVLVNDDDNEDAWKEETVIAIGEYDEGADMWRVTTEGGERKVYYEGAEQSWIHSEEG